MCLPLDLIETLKVFVDVAFCYLVARYFPREQDIIKLNILMYYIVRVQDLYKLEKFNTDFIDIDFQHFMIAVVKNVDQRGAKFLHHEKSGIIGYFEALTMELIRSSLIDQLGKSWCAL